MQARTRLESSTVLRPTRPGAPPTIALLVGVAVASTTVLAAERELDAHEHGAATLDIALDGNRLYLDLDSPADNVLGFEHAPSTDAQKAAVADAEAVLGSDSIFMADAAAGCTLEDVSMAFSFSEEDDDHDADGHDDEAHDDEGHDDEGHDDEGHDEDHDEDDHDADGHEEEGHGDEHDAHEEEGHDDDHEEDGHDDEHADHDDEQSAHSDVTLGQVMLCENPDALRTITTTLFDQFGGFRDIDVQLVGPGGQDGANLTADRPSIELESIL